MINYTTPPRDVPDEDSPMAEFGRKQMNWNSTYLKSFGLSWEKRWNYQGWMLRGIEEKIWITDDQAIAILRYLKIATPDPRK